MKIVLTPTISVEIGPPETEPKMGKKVEKILEDHAARCVELYGELQGCLQGRPTMVVVTVLERLMVRAAIHMGMTRVDLLDSVKRVVEEEYSGIDAGGLQ